MKNRKVSSKKVPYKVWAAAADLFWSKVDRKTEKEYWEWKAARNDWNYGQFQATTGRRKQTGIGAHRYSLMLKLGRRLRPGMAALHDCDNPPCVNPHHLMEGTLSQNTQMCWDRGRRAKPLGAANKQARLDEATVICIRRRKRAGESTAKLAFEYGVSKTAIVHAASGATWSHLEEPVHAPGKGKVAS